MQAGRPLDKRIAEAPTLQLGLQLFLQAFFDLDSERSHAMGVTRIPKSAVRSYARDFGFNAEETEELEYYISVMDNAECKRIVQHRERESKNNRPQVTTR